MERFTDGNEGVKSGTELLSGVNRRRRYDGSKEEK